MSASLRPHGLQHVRLPCPSPTPRVCSNSYPLTSDAIQPSHPLLSSPPAFNFCQHQFFASGGQSIGASASVLLMNIHNRFPLGLTVFFLLYIYIYLYYTYTHTHTKCICTAFTEGKFFHLVYYEYLLKLLNCVCAYVCV